MSASRLFDWIFSVVKWDGILPAIVWSIPTLVRALFPNQRGPVEVVAIVLPIFAIVFRFYLGKRVIVSNNCGTVMRCLQMVALCVGIFFFFVVDALMILVQIMPPAAPLQARELAVLVVLFSIYFGIMLIAMYPGPDPLVDVDVDC